jgi:radical SAM superfamily enzyme YgiQ (UPF0313 family)
MYNFELGPIRPPSEAESILIRLTRNCPWNKCAFCPVYKNKKYSRRTMDDIKSDIDSIHFIYNKIQESIESDDSSNFINNEFLKSVTNKYNLDHSNVRQVAFWMNFGMKNVFLQDADSLVLKTENIVEILNHITLKIPTVQRITTYARSRTVSSKGLDDLIKIRKAGLNRIHIGMESGSDQVLKLIDKGTTHDDQILAGRNAKTAGFEISEYYMPGLGGKNLIQENAIQSAKVINEINPDFIRIRSTVPMPGTPLAEMMTDKTWLPSSEIEKIKELKLFIENLNGINSFFMSDHIMNLLEEINGKLPGDKNEMLDLIDKFLNMQHDDRDSFIIGKRMGYFRKLSEYHKNSEVEKAKSYISENFNTIDEGILEILKNYL